GRRIRARRFVLATGSAPLLPPIPGLDRVPCLTNETIFDQAERPEHLIVIGGGPIGCEPAQAHRRPGSAVTTVQLARLVPRDDRELVDVVRRQLLADGITLLEETRVAAVEPAGAGIALQAEAAGQMLHLTGNTLLVAAGRRPRLDGLGLEAAGIATTP